MQIIREIKDHSSNGRSSQLSILKRQQSSIPIFPTSSPSSGRWRPPRPCRSCPYVAGLGQPQGGTPEPKPNFCRDISQHKPAINSKESGRRQGMGNLFLLRPYSTLCLVLIKFLKFSCVLPTCWYQKHK